LGDRDPYRDTGKTYLGGGMHCPSASSFAMERLRIWSSECRRRGSHRPILI